MHDERTKTSNKQINENNEFLMLHIQMNIN